MRRYLMRGTVHIKREFTTEVFGNSFEEAATNVIADKESDLAEDSMINEYVDVEIDEYQEEVISSSDARYYLTESFEGDIG